MESKMDKNINDVPLSESSVTLRLANIQKRCSQLLDGSGELNDLSLEDPIAVSDDRNPYSRG